ncbi:MAG: hypothetical protein ACLFUZ_03730 [Candidatus Micrarchaeia archaeon]
MVSREEIAEFRKKHFEMERRIDEIGRGQFPTVIRLSEALKDILDGIDTVKQKEQAMHDPHINKRIKLAKRGIKLGKSLKYFEDNIVLEFDKGNLTKETGRRFAEITKHLRKNREWAAKKEFDYFEELMALHQQHRESREKIQSARKELERDRHKAKNLLKILSWVEKQEVDKEKAGKHLQWQESISKLRELRHEHLVELSTKPVGELLENEKLVADQFSGQEEQLEEIRGFFSEYPELGEYKAAEICKLFSASEKKLSHICPETSRFRNSIAKNRKIFETLHSLGSTSYLEPDPENEATMEFYSKNIAGAEGPVKKLRFLAPGRKQYEAAYRKQKKLEEKKKELEGQSREKLEAKLEELNACTELLNAPPEEPRQEKEEKQESLISKISSFFKS